jgi:serine/threonine protein kinase
MADSRRPPETPDEVAPTLVSGGRSELAASAPIASTTEDRYTLGRTIGRGGMGEVVAATDIQIGREVAVKRLHGSASPEGVARFVREARIQARLEHPAIVPVHELSVDREGRPFFVMKRLQGTALVDILRGLREGDTPTIDKYPRQRLLRAFADVCLAVEFAHQKGVIHRDLKPGNIILGDFGEVYVIDWGVARVVGHADEATSPGAAIEDPAATQSGTILGTPGYMAREQIDGASDLDGRADVFALGAILFEILAGAPLLATNLASAITDYDARPSVRAPDKNVPPELDAVCVAATAPLRADRLGSARELGARVQRWLDGDRDLELRQGLAREHLSSARAAFDRDDRRVAMQEAARALALDPTASEAGALVTRLMLEPPRETPQPVVDEVRAMDLDAARGLNRMALFASLTYFTFVPALYWVGMRVPWHLAALGAVIAVTIGMVLLGVRYGQYRGVVVASVIASTILIGVVSRMVSPFLVGPGLAAITVITFAFHPALGRSWILWVVVALGVLAPWLLELFGAVPPTMSTQHGDLVITSPSLYARSPQIEIGLVVYTVVVIAVGGLFGRALALSQWNTRCQLQLQAWHLRQIVATS